MTTIQWDDSFSVGIALIDEQHKTWIQHLNDLSTAVESHLGTEHIAQTLGFLVDYTQFHFATEEKHMRANSYPGLAEHRRKHGELRDTLDNLVQDFEEDGATHILAEALDTFLGNWLIKHIEEVDLKFGTFLSDKGIAISADG
jgi:hemerythrin